MPLMPWPAVTPGVRRAMSVKLRLTRGTCSTSFWSTWVMVTVRLGSMSVVVATTATVAPISAESITGLTVVALPRVTRTLRSLRVFMPLAVKVIS